MTDVRHIQRSWPIVVILTLSMGTAYGQDVIEVLGIGSVGPSQSPIPSWLSEDPAFDLRLVPTRLYDVLAITPDQAQRMLRLYFPRTDDALQSFECLLLSGGDVRYFLPQKIEMMIRAVKSGTAAATDMGGMSKPLHDTWIASGLWEIFPNDVLSVKVLWDGGVPTDQPFRIVVNTELDNNPLLPFLPLGIEKIVGGRSRIIFPRPGSTVYAWMESESLLGRSIEPDPAAAVVWSYGRGRTVALEAWFGHSWWSDIIDPTQNEYGQDILINYLLDVTGRKYIDDIILVHLIRRSFSEFEDHYSYMSNLFDFVERFGANTNSLNHDLNVAREKLVSSHILYLEGDLDGTLKKSQGAISQLIDLRGKAMKLRSRALRWIYAIEWLSITATLMITGYIIDQLMVRKRLYRKASFTRASI